MRRAAWVIQSSQSSEVHTSCKHISLPTLSLRVHAGLTIWNQTLPTALPLCVWRWTSHRGRPRKKRWNHSNRRGSHVTAREKAPQHCPDASRYWMSSRSLHPPCCYVIHQSWSDRCGIEQEYFIDWKSERWGSDWAVGQVTEFSVALYVCRCKLIKCTLKF